MLRRTFFGFLPVVFFLTNLGSETQAQCLQVSNRSTQTKCAEEDNINIPLLGRVSSFVIEATHPRYAVGADSCAADFRNCPPAGSGFSFVPGVFKLFDDGESVVEAVREALWWRPNGMAASVDSGAPVTDAHYVRVSRKILGANEWPQFFVFYMDGNLRLIPHPPLGSPSACFGSSVIIGPASAAARPIAEVASARYLSSSKTMEVRYRAGGSAILSLSEVDRAIARVRVTVNYPTDTLPFATFRSMFVADGNADVDHVELKNVSGASPDDTIMKFRGGDVTEAFFYRSVRSQHNTSAPDIRIKVLEGVCQIQRFVPIVLSTTGMKNSFFSSEMTLTNRGARAATIDFAYTPAFGEGSGTVSDALAAGDQRIVLDAIQYLKSRGIPIPLFGNQGGTLTVRFSGLSFPADGAMTIRTTTPVPNGRAGLAYSGIPSEVLLNEPSYLCGLRQNDMDRSNVAIQNAGTALDGNITLGLTVFSGDAARPLSQRLPDEVLPPGGFRQISGILVSNGLSLSNGFVRVERIAGTAPYYAYAVINDQANSDGSFIPPIPESSLVGRTRMTLPVIVETSGFSSELVATNWSSTKKTLRCAFVSEALTNPDSTARFNLEVSGSEQLIIPDIIQMLRNSGINGIGPKGPAYVGALFVDVSSGDLSGIALAARTSAPGGGGRYGLFYTSVPVGMPSTNTAWLYGLQQNVESRTNLALVNTGETDGSTDTFSIELFDGNTGAKVNAITTTVNARAWKQIGAILAQHAPGVTQGYAHVTRTAGNNPFVAYAIINDGANPGERTGDGAFVASTP